MFKVNSKDTSTTPMACSIVSIVNFEQINISWAQAVQRRNYNPIKHLQWNFLVKIVTGFKPLIISTKNLHDRCLIGF